MSKQRYAPNTETALTNELMRAYFGNSAATGHTHDGSDTDGSVPKINLAAAAHVTGELPLANIAWNPMQSVNMTVVGKTKTFYIYYRITTPTGLFTPAIVTVYVPLVYEADLSGIGTGITAAPTTGYALPDELIPYTDPHQANYFHSAYTPAIDTATDNVVPARAGFEFYNGTPGSGHPDIFKVLQLTVAGLNGWAPFSMSYMIGSR
jgi:hypothetical protein